MKDKITPIPWFCDGETYSELNNLFKIPVRSAKDNSLIGEVRLFLPSTPEEIQKAKSNAFAIVSAINNTYGVGVNPEAVENMKVALHEFIEWAEKNAMWDKVGQSYYRAKNAIEKSKL